MKKKFNVIITLEGGDYVARCSDVPDATGQGKSKEQALDQLREMLRHRFGGDSDDHTV